MRETFPEAMVTRYRGLIPSMTNDPKDRHVLAVAVRANANLIVTGNVSDFPPDACAPYEIEVLSTDGFLCYLWLLHAERLAAVVRAAASDTMNPPRTAMEITEGSGPYLSGLGPVGAAIPSVGSVVDGS